MTRISIFSALLSVLALLTPATPVLAQTSDAATEQNSEDERLNTATKVLDELRQTPDNRVPDWLMQRAYGVAVIPEVIKGAFIFGGRYGNGILTVRDSADRFGDPIFIKLAGGSVGWQVGATSTDVVLIFVTPRSVEKFARGKFTLGVGVAAVAGPLGRQADASAGINAEVYSYSRSRGLFAGVQLDGTVLAFDSRANQFFYHNESITTEMITSGKVSTHAESARRFAAAIAMSTNDAAAAAAPAAVQAAPPPPPSAPAPNPPAAPTGVKTYPMEDTHPGGEPR